jgi:very-short-patch-repair endonuclease
MVNERARHLRKTMTPQEIKLWVHLRELRSRGHHFRRQAPRLNYILDFVCLKRRLIAEVDGSQHGWRTTYDAERDRRLTERGGFRVLRFWNNDIDQNLPGVMQTILAALEPTAPCPTRPAAPDTLPRRGEG